MVKDIIALIISSLTIVGLGIGYKYVEEVRFSLNCFFGVIVFIIVCWSFTRLRLKI